MYRKDNGRPDIDACNVLITIRGECAYTRGMGLNAMIDRPFDASTVFVRADVEDQLRTYEPRVDVDSIDVAYEPEEGNYRLTPYVRRKPI